MHTAAACRAAGASGIVLDDQLWLMPESPMPETWQKHLANLNGQEAITIGERLNASCRVLYRPGFEAIETLQELAEQLERENPQSWREKAEELVGWESPGSLAWPMGQAIGLAADYGERYKTTGRCVQELLNGSREQIKIAQKLQPLGENAPLAVEQGTKYPIVQGPMTRVSDKAEFADAVSQAGGLPLLALALMRGPQVRSLLTEAQQKMGDRPWEIGILGFVPEAVRSEQLQVVEAIRPPFALIAGGRRDQAAQLESLGIATYIHVPVPKLLEMFLEQGARKFVFEGRECGGHVSPLSSFMLWESMISTLLAAGSTDLLAQLKVDGGADSDRRTGVSPVRSPSSDIAIIGMSTLLPKAQDPETFWENIIGKVNAITEIPASRWDWRIYYDPDRNARDKVDSKWGGFIDDVPFDPISFGIPPKSIKSIEAPKVVLVNLKFFRAINRF